MTSLPARRIAVALALTLLGSFAAAQTAAPAKPAPKPAAKPAAKAAEAPADKPGEKTGSLGGKDAGGAILTRDELRACMVRRDELQGRVSRMEAARADMDKERTGIQQDQSQLKADNDAGGGLRPLVDEMQNKIKQFLADNDALAKRIATFNDNKNLSRAEAERERGEINATIEALKTREKTLAAERESLVARNEAHNKAMQTRNTELQARIETWNERNRKLNAEGDTLSEDRGKWTTECGNRRYREDDEKAIQAGK
jgi:chromosome segregation ATPase